MNTFQSDFKSCLYVLAALCVFMFGSCSANKQISKKVNKLFKESSVLNDHLVGFALSDLDKGEMIYEREANKYFIPASNTKLYTFYAGLRLLKDSIPALRYIEKGDSLIFWGTGDPSFLEARLKGISAFNFLKSSSRKLFFAAGRYTGTAYGMGWAWDDYSDPSQTEISELPLYGNLATIYTAANRVNINPAFFADCLTKYSSLQVNAFTADRKTEENVFTYPAVKIPSEFSQQIPYRTSLTTTLGLLTDSLKRNVQFVEMEMPPDAKVIYNIATEDAYREMLLTSDNFIAEQLLLVYADRLNLKLNSAGTIKYILQNELKSLPDYPRWVDGSGMSRMNLFSPRDMITILQLIDKEINNRKKLFSLLPAAGKTGTLKNAYPKNEHPYIFAKTGTFSNNYNQSGYISTKKGRVFSFSFMNNNFITPLARVKEEMAKMMIYIHDNF
jgi:D-alanyl-D-alanine carboxypeptidase/D-alanyl-D-alanine-endopeptidase (penicillin-binding protein 4)